MKVTRKKWPSPPFVRQRGGGAPRERGTVVLNRAGPRTPWPVTSQSCGPGPWCLSALRQQDSLTPLGPETPPPPPTSHSHGWPPLAAKIMFPLCPLSIHVFLPLVLGGDEGCCRDIDIIAHSYTTEKCGLFPAVPRGPGLMLPCLRNHHPNPFPLLHI